MRQGVSALIRRTWARAQSVPELALRLEWWRAYPSQPGQVITSCAITKPCEWRWPNRWSGVADASLNATGPRHRLHVHLRASAGVAAGVTYHRWTVRELLLFPLAAHHGLIHPIDPDNAQWGLKGKSANLRLASSLSLPNAG
jgi:hypothetical protein